ncbi:MAG: hypothetical protein JWP75_2978 [Frondihabitans sp.]|nr:hypothetical protein [Frondihabitans sp.]
MSVLKAKRLRFTPIAIVTGVVGAALLTVSMTGTLSGFVASITNNSNTGTSGSIVMQEKTTGGTPVTCLSTDGGTASTNTSTCSTINKFGSALLTPGNSNVTSITIADLGSVAPGTFTLSTGTPCVQTSVGTYSGTAIDYCSKVNVVITSGATTVFSGTALSLGAATASSFTMPAVLPTANDATSTPFTITATLAAASGNTYQGLQASVPMIWTFTS